MELNDIYIALIGVFIGGFSVYLYSTYKISQLKERMLDKDLVISLLKTNVDTTKKNAYKAPKKVKAKVK
tara:strand:+ start:1140 stop:1346 length:207 start_codon:yes stop_codon:yes gene_type:complete